MQQPSVTTSVAAASTRPSTHSQCRSQARMFASRHATTRTLSTRRSSARSTSQVRNALSSSLLCFSAPVSRFPSINTMAARDKQKIKSLLRSLKERFVAHTCRPCDVRARRCAGAQPHCLHYRSHRHVSHRRHLQRCGSRTHPSFPSSFPSICLSRACLGKSSFLLFRALKNNSWKTVRPLLLLQVSTSRRAGCGRITSAAPPPSGAENGIFF